MIIKRSCIFLFVAGFYVGCVETGAKPGSVREPAEQRENPAFGGMKLEREDPKAPSAIQKRCEPLRRRQDDQNRPTQQLEVGISQPTDSTAVKDAHVFTRFDECP